MTDIAQAFEDLVAATNRVTTLLNHEADRLESRIQARGEAVDQMPTAAANYPAPPPQAPVNWQPTPPEQLAAMNAARDAAVADIAERAQVPAPAPAPSFSEEHMEASFQAAMASGEAPSSVVPDGSPMAAPAAEKPPWEGAAPSAAAATEAPKKSGRRSNEEIAAEVGVDLDAVKAWKGGGRVSKADMEEYKRLNPATVAVQQGVAQATAEPAGAPVPTQASGPFGETPQAAPAAQNVAPNPQYDNGGVLPAAAVTPSQGAPQEWPAAQPAPAEQFGEWQDAVTPSESGWDPFKA